MHSLVGSVVALALITVPNANRADCANAANRYTAAASKIVEALRTYEKCVVSSNKRNDCAAEFEAIEGAQDDFADAVDDLKSCP